MRLSNTFSIAVSGVQAASIAVRAHGHNVANQQTPGFVPTRPANREAAEGVYVHLQKNPEGGTLAAPELDGPVPRNGVDLVQETVGNHLAVAAYRSNLKVLQTAADLTGVVVELRGNTPGDSRDNRG